MFVLFRVLPKKKNAVVEHGENVAKQQRNELEAGAEGSRSF